MLKAIGFALVAAPFIGVACVLLVTLGPWLTIGVFALTGAIVAAIKIGVTLIAA